jgi:hypothetical protein
MPNLNRKRIELLATKHVEKLSKRARHVKAMARMLDTREDWQREVLTVSPTDVWSQLQQTVKEVGLLVANEVQVVDDHVRRNKEGLWQSLAYLK